MESLRPKQLSFQQRPRPRPPTLRSAPIIRKHEQEHVLTSSIIRCRYREITVVMEVPSNEGHTREITESQRALELRKFFAPYLHNKAPTEEAFNEFLTSDGALSAYAETIIWRLQGVHAMVSLVDRAEQYFIAGATRVGAADGDEVVEDATSWFGCNTVPTPGGLCENTIALDATEDPYPCFEVNNLTLDDRFSSLPVVNGSIAAYRFYAGTPITTSNGINIGSFFVFDDKPRPGLSLTQRKFLHQQAANVMKHLETKREAAERRRVALMSKGIANFLERTSRVTEPASPEPSVIESEDTQDLQNSQDQKLRQTGADPIDHKNGVITQGPSGQARDSVLDKIRMTLNHAAAILRESLELNVGGVVFLDTAICYNEAGNTETYSDGNIATGARVQQTTELEGHGQGGLNEVTKSRQCMSRTDDKTGGNQATQSIRSSANQRKAAKVMAVSAAKVATWDRGSTVLDGKTLQSLINSYPKGNIWYIDDKGYFSSLEQVNEMVQLDGTSTSWRSNSNSTIDITKQNMEAAMLSKIFYKARQIIFLPLWDAGGDRWYSGCFVWSQSSGPVFTVESEVAYLSAFTNSVMVEISRLDAITSNKMKSDFISSISHEFRSPLHGILASAEFLRDSDLDGSQIEFISTIQNCSSTLLDTINHVLDYSKINSFEDQGHQQGSISNELYQVTNLALLCEDLINGMMAAGEFRGSSDPSIPLSKDSSSRKIRKDPNSRSHGAVEIILEIENQDWTFKVQAGALRRIVMNIFGNAQKYTESGYISVNVRIQKMPQDSPQRSPNTSLLLIDIRDSGRGMSTEYMERKLYQPFAQEDPFAPGVGLGLSIVWSIVNQIGGKIHIRSEIGKGTDVQITLPVDRPDGSETAHSRPGDLTKISADAEKAITTLQARASGKSIVVSKPLHHSSSPYKDESWNCIERYCSDWFGYQVISCRGNADSTKAELVIIDHEDELAESVSEFSGKQRVLVVHEHMDCCEHHRQHQRPVGQVCTPIGPFKLARCILALLDQEIPNKAARAINTSDRCTQTPLASPEERMAINGIPMTDYGFTAPLSIPEFAMESPDTQKSNTQQISKFQNNNTMQALADLHSLSLYIPSRYSTQTQTTPGTSISSSSQIVNEPEPTSNLATSTGALHILAVDDNAINLQLIHRYLLKRKSDTIITARNGVEAVAAVRKAAHDGKSFDIIFMDISMPEMDGFEATRLIRSFERSFAHRSISEDMGYFDFGEGKPNEDMEKAEQGGYRGRSRIRAYVVALTGLASRRDRDEAESSGFDDFLTKPISFGKIGDLLKRLSAEKGGE